MKHPFDTASLSALLVVLGACQSTAPLDDEAAHTSVIELDRVHWQIGDLDAETVFLLEDESCVFQKGQIDFQEN